METRSGFGCGRGNEGHHVGLWSPGPDVTSKAAPRAVSGRANGVNAGDREGRQRGAVPPVWPLWDHVKEPRRVMHLPPRADETRIGVSPAPPSLLPQGAAWTRGSRDSFPCGHWTTVPSTLSPRQSGRKAGPVVGFCALSRAGQPDHFPLNGHWRDSLIQIFSSSEQSKSLTETAQGPGSTPTWGPRPAQSCGDPASSSAGPNGARPDTGSGAKAGTEDNVRWERRASPEVKAGGGDHSAPCEQVE